jgi:ABC-2 type transport system permease protein
MIDLVRAELLKLQTTRMVYAMLGALLLIVAIATVGVILGTRAEEELKLEGDQAGIFSTAAGGVIFVLLLGVMLMSGEFRHGTITQTLLITPNRWKVLGAKLVAAAILGFAFGVLAELLAFVLGAPLFELRVGDFIFEDEARNLIFGVILATTVSAPFGVAIGSLIRNQVVAIVVVFAGLLIVEPIVTGLLEIEWREPSKYLPSQVTAGVIGGVDEDPNGLSRGAATAVLLAYVGVLSALGGRFVLSRDVNSIQA